MLDKIRIFLNYPRLTHVHRYTVHMSVNGRQRENVRHDGPLSSATRCSLVYIFQCVVYKFNNATTRKYLGAKNHFRGSLLASMPSGVG